MKAGRSIRSLIICVVCLSPGVLWQDKQQRATASTETPTTVFFEDEVEAILERRCLKCHADQSRKGGVDLSSAEAVLGGGDSGLIVEAGNPSRSLIYEVVHSKTMPPEGDPLPSGEIEAIRQWIQSGARFRKQPDVNAIQVEHHQVLSILLLRCTACHGADIQRGGLDLRSYQSLSQGGESGEALVPGDPDASLMIQRVEKQLCPPQNQLLKYFVRRPSSHEVDMLRRWILQGASHQEPTLNELHSRIDKASLPRTQEHWAFQPLPTTVAVPHVAGQALENPIDRFILQPLQANGFALSPPADRHVLIRRVYIDLIGLPPTLEEWVRWMNHPASDWYPQMIDELLQSPGYGERWGRYWLDLAGYADSEGGVAEDVVRDVAWKYRDYVVAAFQSDKPYDRFLWEQIAGDELADFRDPAAVDPSVVENLIATGFLRMGVDQTGSRTMNFFPERIGVIADALNVLSSGVLGLTMECARCHNHKYDPISQQDYYRFKAIFQGAFDEFDWMSWKTRKLEVASPELHAQHKATNAPLEKEIKQLETTRSQRIKKHQDVYYAATWPKISEAEQKEILMAIQTTTDRRTLRQDELVERYETEIRPIETILRRDHHELSQELDRLDQQLNVLREKLLPPLAIRALWDRGRPSPTYLLVRGEAERPAHQVSPGIPFVLSTPDNVFAWQPPSPSATSTGRRLAFAKWLTTPNHPLTARVFVNRVWKHHFGQGIVKSLDNFGKLGSPPSHPELLDWLARHFIDANWSLKSLHRTLLLSQTYQQSSAINSALAKADPENRWLGRMTMQRLDAEALRDSLLHLAGKLDGRIGGPPAKLIVREDGLISDLPSTNGMHRRSVYLQLRRTEMPTLLTAFDYPDMQPNCSQRSVSIVSPQSLILSNNAMIHAWSAQISQRILERADETNSLHQLGLRVDLPLEHRFAQVAYRSLLQRIPDPDEIEEAATRLSQFQNAWKSSGVNVEVAANNARTTFVHTLINSAEFLYVD